MKKINLPTEIFGKKVGGAIERALSNPEPEVPSNPVINPGVSSDFSYLEGDFGKTILEEYNTLVAQDYGGASALKVLKFKDGIVKGSNPYAFVLLNKVLQKYGRWVARPGDLEKCLKEGALDLKGTYGDSALIFRDNGEPNKYLSGNLYDQVNNLGNFVAPLMFPLADLDLVNDQNSPSKLAFKLTESGLIYAPQFEHSNNGKKFNERDEDGLPIFDENGTRTLYIKNGGLRRLYRSGNLNLNARSGCLAGLGVAGRVIVCAEGTRA